MTGCSEGEARVDGLGQCLCKDPQGGKAKGTGGFLFVSLFVFVF